MGGFLRYHRDSYFQIVGFILMQYFFYFLFLIGFSLNAHGSDDEWEDISSDKKAAISSSTKEDVYYLNLAKGYSVEAYSLATCMVYYGLQEKITVGLISILQAHRNYTQEKTPLFLMHLGSTLSCLVPLDISKNIRIALLVATFLPFFRNQKRKPS